MKSIILTVVGIALSTVVFAQSKKGADTTKAPIEWKLQNPNAKPVLAPQDDIRPFQTTPFDPYFPENNRYVAPQSNIHTIHNTDTIPKK
jgi:hypothetical protein